MSSSPDNRYAGLVGVAIAILLTACSRTPVDELAKGKEALSAGDTPTAIIHFKSALQDNNLDAEARLLLGTSLLRIGDVEGALIELEKVHQLDHQPDTVVPALANALVRAGRNKAAIDRFSDTDLPSPRAAASLAATLAVAHWQLNERKETESALDRALRLDENQLDALLLKARLSAADGDIDAALAATESLLARHPKELRVLMFRAGLLEVGKGDVEQAAQTLEKAIEIEPKYIDAHKAIILQLIRRDDIDAATERLKRLEGFAPKHSITRYLSASLAYAQRDFDRARETLQPLLKGRVQGTELLILAGLIEQASGQAIKAETHYVKAMNQSSEDLAPRLLLADLQVRRGQGSKALATLEPLAKQAPVDARVLALAADAHLQLGQWERAESLYAAAVKASPDNSRSKVALASLRAAQGDGAAGLNELQLLSRQASAERLYADIALFNAQLRKRDLDAAMASAERLAALRPELSAPWMMKAAIFERRKDGDNAKRSLNKALELDPDNLRAVMRLAQYDAHEGKLEKAIERLQPIASGEQPYLNAQLAQLAFRRQNGLTPEQALPEAEKIARLHPNQVEARLNMINLLSELGLSERALEEAQKANAAIANQPWLMLALAEAQIKGRSPDQALATIRRVGTMAPNDAGIQYRVAQALLQSGQRGEAISALRRSIALDPNSLLAQRALIGIQTLNREFDQALKLARSMQKQRPDVDIGHLLEGDIESARAQWRAAERAYRAALAVTPSGEAAAKRHQALLAMEERGEAAKFSDEWQKQHPQDAAFFSHLAALASKNGNWPEAEQHWLKVTEIVPRRAIAWSNLAVARAEQGKLDNAITDARKGVELAPGSDIAHATLSKVLARAGQMSASLVAQRKAVALSAQDSFQRLRLAELLQQSGDRKAARDELADLLRRDPRFAERSDAQALQAALR